MLTLSGVSKSYGAKVAIRDVDAAFPLRGVTFMAGANGSGKSTLLRCILGLVPHSGTICWDGVPLRAADHRFSPLFDDMPMYPRLTGAQNLRLLGERGLRGAADRYLDESLSAKKVGTYSYGQRKRLALVVALDSPAPYVILDEPFNGLDQEATERLRRDIAAQRHERGFLITSHAIHETDELIDKAFTMSDGVLREVSRPTREPKPCLDAS